MLLLLDGNNLAWAGYYALERAMKPEDDERRARIAALGVAAGILGNIARGGLPPAGGPPPVAGGQLSLDAASPKSAAPKLTRAIVCFDEGRPLRRRAIFPPYQTGREHDPKFIANEPTILAAIQEFIDDAAPLLPIEVVRGVNVEADDLIAGIAQANPRAAKRIVSTDRDFLQLIGPRTSIYAPVKKLVIDEANFETAVTPKDAPSNLTPAIYLDYRAMTGDPSDTLPGVPGVGPLSAIRLLAQAPADAYFGDAAAVRAALGRRSDAAEGAFADGAAREIITRNRTLMDLRLPAPCWDELDALTSRGAWRRSKFESWLERQRFSSIDQPALIAQLETLAAAK